MSDNAPQWGAVVAPMSTPTRVEGEATETATHNTTFAAPSLDNTKNPWILPKLPELAAFDAPVELPYATDALNEDQLKALTIWENTKKQLATLKDFEMMVRKAIVYDGGFFDEDKTNGVEHVTLGGGYTLSGTKKETYKLDSDKVEDALANFSEEEANLLVSWAATLSVSNYKKLTPEKQAFFNYCLEIKTGAPTLEIKAPKVKE